MSRSDSRIHPGTPERKGKATRRSPRATVDELASASKNTLPWKPVFWALLALVFITYLPSLSVPFHFDDSHTIEGNAAVKSLWNIPRFFTDVSTASIIPDNRSYRPLTFVVFALCWALGGGATWAFHLSKILMHAGTAFFLFLIWRRLLRTPGWWPAKGLELGVPVTFRTLRTRTFQVDSEMAALLLAILFSIHTACSEIVTYIVASTSLQCAVLYVGAFWFYLLRRDGRPKRMSHLLGSLALYASATLSKEEGITLPAMVVVTEFMLCGAEGTRPFMDRVKEAVTASIPYWLVALAMAGVIHEMTPVSFAKSRGNLPPLEYFFTQWRAYLWYMKIWLLPTGLNADNEVFGFSHTFQEPEVVLAFIGNLALIAAGWIYRKRYPAFAFGLLWYYITISPASSIVPLAEPVNERRMYLAYIGFIGGSFVVALSLLARAQALRQNGTRRITPLQTSAAFAVMAIALFVGTRYREYLWQDPQRLWEDTAEKNPDSGRAMNNLALNYMKDPAKFPKALELLNHCEQVWSQYMYCPLNKAAIYMTLKDVPNAEKSILRAQTLDPESTWVNLFLGEFYQDLKPDFPKALTFLAKADQLAGGSYIEAKVRMAQIYMKTGDQAQSARVINEIRSLDPENPWLRSVSRSVAGS